MKRLFGNYRTDRDQMAVIASGIITNELITSAGTIPGLSKRLRQKRKYKDMHALQSIFRTHEFKTPIEGASKSLKRINFNPRLYRPQ